MPTNRTVHVRRHEQPRSFSPPRRALCTRQTLVVTGPPLAARLIPNALLARVRYDVRLRLADIAVDVPVVRMGGG